MKTLDSAIKRILVVEGEPSIGNMCRRVLTSKVLKKSALHRC